MNKGAQGRLAGKSAIVTGASKGIGAEIAKMFAREGAEVLVNFNNSESEAKNIVEYILSQTLGSTRAISFRADVSKLSEVKSMVVAAMKEFGKIDILVNNAGILIPKKFLDTTEDDFDRVLGINLKGAFFCCQQVAPIMLDQKRGKIINIPSISGLAQPSGLKFVDYVSSKAGMIGLTRSLAVNLAPELCVNAICPGTVETDIVDFLPEETKRNMKEESLVKRLGTPADIAYAAVYLASDESDFVTGEIITVGGGRGMR